MDPYLEDPAFWPGFHGELIYACRALLLSVLPPNYDADVGEQLQLVEASEDEPDVARAKDVVPDVAVTRSSGAEPSLAAGQRGRGGVATLDLEPVTIVVPSYREIRQRWIAVRHLPERSLVTAIEVLSPANKAGHGFGEYQLKRQALLRQNANLVEIDLLLGGRRLEPSGRMPTGDYFAVVSRADRPSERDVFGWPVRRPLPKIPVPLRAPSPDVVLDLSRAVATAYDRGGYGRRLRYEAKPPAALREEDAKWAHEIAAGGQSV
jgi:hypothetical protein